MLVASVSGIPDTATVKKQEYTMTDYESELVQARERLNAKLKELSTAPPEKSDVLRADVNLIELDIKRLNERIVRGSAPRD